MMRERCLLKATLLARKKRLVVAGLTVCPRAVDGRRIEEMRAAVSVCGGELVANKLGGVRLHIVRELFVARGGWPVTAVLVQLLRCIGVKLLSLNRKVVHLVASAGFVDGRRHGGGRCRCVQGRRRGHR